VLLLTAVHAQPAAVVTATVALPPPSRIGRLVVLNANVHGALLACVTVTVAPATVSVPVRCAPVFAATVAVTLPLPLPLAPLVIVMKLALLVAVQVQPAFALTGMVSEPPPASAVRFNWSCGTTGAGHVVGADGVELDELPHAAMTIDDAISATIQTSTRHSRI